jgi:hypothetical protein
MSGVQPTRAVEGAGSAEPVLVLRPAAGCGDDGVGLLPEARRHQVQSGVVDPGLAAVEPEAAVADQDEAQHRAGLDRERQGGAEAPRRVATRDLQDAVRLVGGTDRRRHALDQPRRIGRRLGRVEEEAGDRALDDPARHSPREHAVVAVPGAVGDAVDHRRAAAGKDEKAVLVGAGIVEVLALAERLDTHPSRLPAKMAPSEPAIAAASRLLHYHDNERRPHRRPQGKPWGDTR